MAFLDGISKKITDATSSAAQKTRDMAEISKLNSSINEEESKLNNAYLQIGKLYCATHGSDYEESFGALVNTVMEAEKRIADLNDQIREIKGIALCSACGSDLLRNASFCSVCGAPNPKAPVAVPTSTLFCPGCGNSVAQGMRFCTCCGFRMPEVIQPEIQQTQEQVVCESVPDVSIPEAEDDSRLDMSLQDVIPDNSTDVNEQEIPAPYDIPVQQNKFCPNCGKESAEGMLFCTQCGTRL